jgi:hypothetical protein
MGAWWAAVNAGSTANPREFFGPPAGQKQKH